MSNLEINISRIIEELHLETDKQTRACESNVTFKASTRELKRE